MKRRPIIAAALVLGSALTVVTFVQTYPVWAIDPGSETAFIDKDFEVALRKHVQKRFFNFIDASDTQRSQITSILDERAATTAPEREKLRAEAIELSQLMASDASDDKVVDKVHELREVLNKLMDERLTTTLKVRALLKPDQRKAISDKIVALLTGHTRSRLLR
jgi:Spy/CpxP family protein refolding chaperone